MLIFLNAMFGKSDNLQPIAPAARSILTVQVRPTDVIRLVPFADCGGNSGGSGFIIHAPAPKTRASAHRMGGHEDPPRQRQRFRILLSRTAKIVCHSSFSPIRGSRAFALFKIAE